MKDIFQIKGGLGVMDRKKFFPPLLMISSIRTQRQPMQLLSRRLGKKLICTLQNSLMELLSTGCGDGHQLKMLIDKLMEEEKSINVC